MRKARKTLAAVLLLVGLLLTTACGSGASSATARTPTPRALPSATSTPMLVPTFTPGKTPAAPTVSSGRLPMGGRNGPFSLNLDNGRPGATPDSGDFFLIVGSEPDSGAPVYCAVVSIGQALVFNLGVLNFANVTLGQLQQAANNEGVLRCYTTSDAPTELVTGDVFGVRTNGNHYAKVQVASNNFAQGLAVTFQWVTFAS